MLHSGRNVSIQLLQRFGTATFQYQRIPSTWPPRSAQRAIMNREITPPPSKRGSSDQTPVTSSENRCEAMSPDAKRRKQVSADSQDKESTVRIFSWNINGISPFIQKPITSFFHPVSKPKGHAFASPASASLRSFLYRHAWPQCLLLQEVKINPQDEHTKRAVHVAVNDRLGGQDTGPNYNVFFTLPRDKYNARGFGSKVYGVATIMREDFESAHDATVRDVDWDIEGRVSIVETNTGLAILNIYAVNGTSKIYRDPQTGDTTGKRHDRKRAFHSLLLDECKTLQAQGKRVIVAGDLNVARDARDGRPNLREFPSEHVVNRADFNRKFIDDESGLRGVDVWRAMKGDERKYTYHPRTREWGFSCDRVDLVIVSRSLWEDGMVVDAGILDSKQERGLSDHVPIYVEVRVEQKT